MNEHDVEILLIEDSPDDVELTLHALRRIFGPHLLRLLREVGLFSRL